MSETEDAIMSIKPTFRNVLLLAAVLSVSLGTVIFVSSFPSRGKDASDLVWAILVMAVMGAFTAFMHRFRLTTLLTVTLLGYIVGLTSALQLLAVPNVIGGYAVAVLTVATFAGHGIVIGMFAEFVVWLHRLTHGLLDRVAGAGERFRLERKEDEKIRFPENRS